MFFIFLMHCFSNFKTFGLSIFMSLGDNDVDVDLDVDVELLTDICMLS